MAHPTPTRGLGPETPRADAARRLLTSRIADVRRYEAALARSADVDPVHDMRVASRRLRAALQVFARAAPDRLPRLEREVKRLQDALGALRDVHVQGQWLEQTGRRTRGSARTGLRLLQDAQRAQRSQQETALLRALSRWERRTAPALLDALAQLRGGGRYGGPRSRRHLSEGLARVQRRLRAYAAAPDARRAHRLRIAVKRLRYAAEVLRPALRRRMTALLEALTPLQEPLGALHDADVRLEWLGALAARGEAPVRSAARALLPEAQAQRHACAAETAREVQRWRTEHLVRALRSLTQ